MLSFVKTNIANHEYIFDEDGDLIGVVFDRGFLLERRFMKGDRVYVSDDGFGYIGPGLTHPCTGTIAEIRLSDSDHYFYVIMDDGETGTCKEARLQKLDAYEVGATSARPGNCAGDEGLNYRICGGPDRYTIAQAFVYAFDSECVKFNLWFDTPVLLDYENELDWLEVSPAKNTWVVAKDVTVHSLRHADESGYLLAFEGTCLGDLYGSGEFAFFAYSATYNARDFSGTITFY